MGVKRNEYNYIILYIKRIKYTMRLDDELEYQKRYIKDNNYTPICVLSCGWCCEYNWYYNGNYYLQQFICYLYKDNDNANMNRG